MNATTRVLLVLTFPFALAGYVAFQLWVLVDRFPSYARSVWWEWVENTRSMARYLRTPFTGEAS